mmetsp:Transcript_12043/g.34401  ORF Transcript_12043/g.34401 Transcript_12043/m.34401 type:complete len:386 (-) Transcript_12043:272-1429(-)
MTVEGENVGAAFGLVILAGAATGIGAAVVFFPSIVKLASRRVLAASLGFSAGVMCYVSFIEIFRKSVLAFQESTGNEGHAYAFATLTFFGGVVLMMILNAVVSALLGGHGHNHSHHHTAPTHDDVAPAPHKTTRQEVDTSAADLGYNPPCCTKDPVSQLDTFKKMASVLQHELDSDEGDDDKANQEKERTSLENADQGTNFDAEDSDKLHSQADHCTEQAHEGTNDNHTTEENKRLVKMGLTTALAIGLHNFPEGLATFVAAVDNPKVGIVLAVAISIHNIPEGLCVALPIFYATGNRNKAFCWALLSGASEIVAAFLGWLILSNVFTEAIYGTLFGLVAGMMVIISIRELLPTAHFYDPDDTVVTYSFITGMMVMALSLVLFVI